MTFESIYDISFSSSALFLLVPTASLGYLLGVSNFEQKCDYFRTRWDQNFKNFRTCASFCVNSEIFSPEVREARKSRFRRSGPESPGPRTWTFPDFPDFLRKIFGFYVPKLVCAQIFMMPGRSEGEIRNFTVSNWARIIQDFWDFFWFSLRRPHVAEKNKTKRERNRVSFSARFACKWPRVRFK